MDLRLTEPDSDLVPAVMTRACGTVGRDLMTRGIVDKVPSLVWRVEAAPEVDGWRIGLSDGESAYLIGASDADAEPSALVSTLAEAAQEYLFEEGIQWPLDLDRPLSAELRDGEPVWVRRGSGEEIGRIGHLSSE